MIRYDIYRLLILTRLEIQETALNNLTFTKFILSLALLSNISCAIKEKKSGNKSTSSNHAPYEDEAFQYESANNDSTSVDSADYQTSPGQVMSEEEKLEGDDQEAVKNEFINTSEEDTSTFSIDVDTASYTLARQLINSQILPTPQQIRTEEFINYFKYEYPEPADESPFAVSLESMPAPWQAEHQLLKIGIQGKDIDISSRPMSNLVFLLDVSGSMSAANKLGLIKHGLTMMTEHLTENDRVAIVVYAGAAGVVLESTTGDQQEKIIGSLAQLQAGGSTNGSQGIELAYKIAVENKIEGGINRVILGTDGDFNVGPSSTEALNSLIIEKAATGIELSVLGVGMGYMGDHKMESLANKGNGNYYYLDSQSEAERVLTEELSGTLQTIAKDVKLQISFTPEKVASYKLIGYENRRLANEDFDDDTKDAGELGAGHTVTALYEIKLAEGVSELDSDSVNLQLRYKQPGSDESQLLEASNVLNQASTEDFNFINAVTAFALKLKNSSDVESFSFDAIIELAGGLDNANQSEERQEFVGLVEKVKSLSEQE